MVEVSKLRSLDIYTNTGHYVGKVEDIVLNIRLGTISKLQVRAIEQERRPVGIIDQFRETIRGAPEEAHVRAYQSDLLTVDFDKVQAIGDIMLINPRDMKKISPENPIPEAVAPNVEGEAQQKIDNKPQFDIDKF